MEMTPAWDRVGERFQELGQFARLRPTVDAMLWLVGALREDPRLGTVVPSVSLASLNLKLSDFKQYVIVEWNDSAQRSFDVSFVDPPLEFSETKTVGEAEVVETIKHYLDRLH
jgi:hypothetical protein